MTMSPHPAVLHKIAAYRSRIGYTATSPAWVTFTPGSAPAVPRGAPELRSRQRLPALAPGPQILTRRELEVLELVARGKTDQGIADQLNVSRRTINSHVANILTKLDVKSRTSAAITAARIGLL
jgi:DNA-binding NarL/FixJ family response regulator